MTQQPMTTGALLATVKARHAQTYPGGCPMLCEECAARLGITAPETEADRLTRVRRNIERKFGHARTGVARG